VKNHLLLPAILFLSLAARPAASAVVGYVNTTFVPGTTAFENPLLAADNHLSALFPTAPDGSYVSLWNAGAQAYFLASIYSSGTGWSINYDLEPGTGALFYSTAASSFVTTFVGTVLNHDGTVAPGGGYPPPFYGTGLYLLGDKAPVQATGTDIFHNILGRLPGVGEQLERWNVTSQAFDTYTYEGGGTWNVTPTLNYGEAAFFNLNVVPEPSVASLTLLGLALLGRRLCREE